MGVEIFGLKISTRLGECSDGTYIVELKLDDISDESFLLGPFKSKKEAHEVTEEKIKCITVALIEYFNSEGAEDIQVERRDNIIDLRH